MKCVWNSWVKTPGLTGLITLYPLLMHTCIVMLWRCNFIIQITGGQPLWLHQIWRREGERSSALMSPGPAVHIDTSYCSWFSSCLLHWLYLYFLRNNWNHLHNNNIYLIKHPYLKEPFKDPVQIIIPKKCLQNYIRDLKDNYYSFVKATLNRSIFKIFKRWHISNICQ